MANSLLAAGVWHIIGSVLLAILILLVMITIHEFGHYIVGKLLNFKINEFSIGFGPALFKHRNKRTGELFAVRLIPLGGYCAFDGEDGLEEPPEEPFAETETPPETPSESPSEGQEQQEGAETVLVTPPETVGEEPENEASSSDMPPTNLIEGGNSASEEHKNEGAPAPTKPAPGAFTEKKPWQRILVLIAGALMNYLLALVLIIVLFSGYGQTMIAVYRAAPTEEIPAEYCLKDLDILLEAEGRDLYLTTDLAKALNGKKAGDLVTMRISRVTGENEETKKYIREEMTVEVMLRADVSVKNSADLDCVYRALGFLEEESEEGTAFSIASASYRFGFFEMLGRSFVYSFKIAGSIFKVIGELLTGKLGLNALGGPISTITITSQVAGSSARGFFEISAYIGVNLAVFNLLPIPALDGSKVVFTLIEWVRGKPISRKVEAIIHTVGFFLLLGFAVLVDILQFV